MDFELLKKSFPEFILCLIKKIQNSGHGHCTDADEKGNITVSMESSVSPPSRLFYRSWKINWLLARVTGLRSNFNVQIVVFGCPWSYSPLIFEQVLARKIKPFHKGGELSGKPRFWFCDRPRWKRCMCPENLLCCSRSSSFCSLHLISLSGSMSVC